MRGIAVHKGEIDISFSAGRPDPRTSRPVADVARRRITIWLAMTAACFARLRGRRARIELYGLICNARTRACAQARCRGVPRERARAGERARDGRALREHRARMLIGRARQGFPLQARIRLAAPVRGKRARRDRPTSTDKLSAQLFIRRNDTYPACRCRFLKTELCRNEDEILQPASGFDSTRSEEAAPDQLERLQGVVARVSSLSLSLSLSHSWCFYR